MEKKKAPPPVADINVTPMVDVMLVVLIIFMVITPMLSKTVPLDLAQARNPALMPDADKEDSVVVAITRDGQAYISPGIKKINADQLAPVVRDLLDKKPNKLVFIKADARAKYERVEDVVDNLRAGGVDQLGLLTDQMVVKAKPGAATPDAATGNKKM